MELDELAKATGCEVETIRYCEREGLLAAPARSEAGYRQYVQHAVDQLNFVRHCRSLDMSLVDIRRLAARAVDPDAACDEVDAVVDTHMDRVRLKLASLHASKAQLVKRRAQCGALKRGTPCQIVASLQRPAQDERCACHAEANQADQVSADPAWPTISACSPKQNSPRRTTRPCCTT